jgi:sugar phosphate permease
MDWPPVSNLAGFRIGLVRAASKGRYGSGFSVFGLSMFAMLLGLDFVATAPPSVRLIAQEVGRERAPVVFGWCFAAHQLGAGAMAFAAGLARDALSTYLPAFLVAGALCIIAATSFSLLRNQPGRAALSTAAR